MALSFTFLPFMCASCIFRARLDDLFVRGVLQLRFLVPSLALSGVSLWVLSVVSTTPKMCSLRYAMLHVFSMRAARHQSIA